MGEELEPMGHERGYSGDGWRWAFLKIFMLFFTILASVDGDGRSTDMKNTSKDTVAEYVFP